jgi:hypothetical protein
MFIPDHPGNQPVDVSDRFAADRCLGESTAFPGSRISAASHQGPEDIASRGFAIDVVLVPIEIHHQIDLVFPQAFKGFFETAAPLLIIHQLKASPVKEVKSDGSSPYAAAVNTASSPPENAKENPNTNRTGNSRFQKKVPRSRTNSMVRAFTMALNDLNAIRRFIGFPQ